MHLAINNQLYHYIWMLNDSPEVALHLGRRNRWVKGRRIAASPLQVLEDLFEEFNHGVEPGRQPEGFRSMSVGDFVSLSCENEEEWVTWVCCGNGWQVVPASEMPNIPHFQKAYE